MTGYKYFKHINGEPFAIQNGFTKSLTEYLSNDLEYFEVQLVEAKVMQSRLKQEQTKDWVSITHDEFIKLMSDG